MMMFGRTWKKRLFRKPLRFRDGFHPARWFLTRRATVRYSIVSNERNSASLFK